MIVWNMDKRFIFGVLIGLVLIFSGICFVCLYQPESKTEEIYKSALKDFNDGNYQNSYYLFSKISIFSNLKPIAIYHRAECAKMLDDKKSEIKQYEILFNNYPKHKLSLKAKYLTAQKIFEEKPSWAKRYFEQIIQYAPDTDYAIASEYYLGLILKNKYKDEKFIPKSVKDDIENYFRHYLKKAPAGRLAYSAVKQWLELSDNILPDDYLLMADTSYIFGEYEKANELIQKADLTNSWTLYAKIAYELKDYSKVKELVRSGLSQNSNYVSEDDIIDAIDIYKNINNSTNDLLNLANGKGRDYLISLKCETLPKKEAQNCYNNLYLTYPNGRFAADALSKIFFYKIKSGDIQNAIKIGKDHIQKFPNSKSAPMVMFWLGKVYENLNSYNEYNYYYQNTIEKFPDSYYAYRAYLKLKQLHTTLIPVELKPEPVVYPYNFTKNNIIVKLVNLGDYDIVNEFAANDKFIKSWVMYKKGEYTNSIITARDAMKEMTEKPNKSDLRWRLVYPVMYYDYVKQFADKTGNNTALMLALLREESHFNPLAQSNVGAAGLMQLMPSTANEINSRFALGLNLPQDLFNPEKNIELGNYYYEFLRNNLEGLDISSVAAYNGGIGSLKTWKTNLHYNDTDEFVEQIPYFETKNYVKKVFASYWNYVRIYSGY